MPPEGQKYNDWPRKNARSPNRATTFAVLSRMPSFLFLLMLLAAADASTHPTADEIISRSIEALGGYERIHAIKSLNYSGVYREGHYVGNGAHMTRMRPNKRLVGCVPHVCDGRADSYLEIFDGERGWE